MFRNSGTRVSHTLWVAGPFACLLMLLSLALSILLYPSEADASSLATSASVSGTYESCSNAGTGSASCQTSGTQPLGGGSATFGGAASARSSYGDLGTSAADIASCNGVVAPYNCTGFNGGQAIATAQFNDLFNITNGPSSGFLVFQAFTDGTSNVTCVGLSASYVCGNSVQNTFISVTDSLINGVSGNTVLTNGVQNLTIVLPYQSGVVSATFMMQSAGHCFATDDTNCKGTSDYYQTFGISGLSVEDSNGIADPNAIVTTGSGTNYNDIQALTVPEPGTSVLFGIVLFAAMAFRPRAVRERGGHGARSAATGGCGGPSKRQR